MRELIAKLAAAPRGMRALDMEIFRAVTDVEAHREWALYHGMRPKGSPPDPEGFSERYAPRYTGSLDAALTLVPEGWHIKLERFSDGWYAHIWKIEGDPASAKGDQKPAPLAVCIAAMKARALLAAITVSPTEGS